MLVLAKNGLSRRPLCPQDMLILLWRDLVFLVVQTRLERIGSMRWSPWVVGSMLRRQSSQVKLVLLVQQHVLRVLVVLLLVDDLGRQAPGHMVGPLAPEGFLMDQFQLVLWHGDVDLLVHELHVGVLDYCHCHLFGQLLLGFSSLLEFGLSSMGARVHWAWKLVARPLHLNFILRLRMSELINHVKYKLKYIKYEI